MNLTKQELEGYVSKGDAAFNAKKYEEAVRCYSIVTDTVEELAKEDQKGVNLFSAAVGGALGGAFLGPLGALGGAIFGWQVNKNRAKVVMSDSEYADVYYRAIEGVARCMRYG